MTDESPKLWIEIFLIVLEKAEQGDGETTDYFTRRVLLRADAIYREVVAHPRPARSL